MNVVFLDVDGVLNNNKTSVKTPMGFTGIGSRLLDRLATLVHLTDSVVVLSSTWKDEWDKDPRKTTPDGEYLNDKLRKSGIVIADKIDNKGCGESHRGAAIQNYLDSHLEIEDYVVLDDFEFDFEDYEAVFSHFVQTDYNVGFTEEKLEEALNIMGFEYPLDIE